VFNQYPEDKHGYVSSIHTPSPKRQTSLLPICLIQPVPEDAELPFILQSYQKCVKEMYGQLASCALSERKRRVSGWGEHGRWRLRRHRKTSGTCYTRQIACCLFNDAVCSSDCTLAEQRDVNWAMNLEGRWTGRSGNNALGLYLVGAGFEYRSGLQLFWLRIFVVFFSPCYQYVTTTFLKKSFPFHQ
jgi:hypothetical protein